MNKKLDIKSLGMLRTISYEKDGVIHTVPWQTLHKRILSKQVCLVTEDGIVLPIMRMSRVDTQLHG